MPGSGRDRGEQDNGELQRALARYDLLKRLIPAVWVLAAWVPLRAVYPIASVLAGKHTNVALTFSVSIAFSVALGAGYVALRRKERQQGRELLRLRQRCATLEGELRARAS